MKWYRCYPTLFVLLLLSGATNAQILRGLSARFNDAFVDWEVFVSLEDDDEKEEKGNLTMTWQNPDDWSQWSYRIGDATGNVKTQWARDFDRWEIRGDNKVITASTLFKGDYRQWRITDNNFSVELTCNDRFRCEEWTVDDVKHGKMTIITHVPTDFRDWDINDELDPSVSFPMKMAILFVATFSSVPKR